MPKTRRGSGPGRLWFLAACAVVEALILARLRGVSTADATLIVLTLTLLAATAYAKVTHDLYRQGREQLEGWRRDRRILQAAAMVEAVHLLDEAAGQVRSIVAPPHLDMAYRGNADFLPSYADDLDRWITDLQGKSLEVGGQARLEILGGLEPLYELKAHLGTFTTVNSRTPEPERQKHAGKLSRLVETSAESLTKAGDEIREIRRSAVEEARAEA